MNWPRHYAAAGDPGQAAIIFDEKASVIGITPQTAAALRQAYGTDSCALAEVGSNIRLNLDCPHMLANLCRAWSDLAQAFTEARMPNPAAYFRQTAADRKCPN